MVFLSLCRTYVTKLPENLTVDGDLFLTNTLITELPDNLIVGGSLCLNYSNITKLPDNLTVGGYLDLIYTHIKKLPNHLVVGSSLNVYHTDITNLPNNLIVGGSINLSCTKIQKIPNDLKVCGSLDLSDTHITDIPENVKIKGSLDLNYTGNVRLPNNLTVVGDLNLYNSGILSLPNNLTVGGYFNLNNTGIKSLPNNLTVGRCIDPTGTNITNTEKVNITLSPKQKKKINDLKNMVLFWERDGVKYIKADGIFSVIDSHHGNVYKVHKLGEEDKPFYLITDGENHWAHGETLKEAKADLIYKINDRDTSDYKNLSLDDTLSVEEAIAAYRTITGACSQGTRDFIESRLPSPHKDKYTIREIIDLTRNEYGGEKFAQFFKEK